MKPLVSVLIPCHNAAPYIAAAMESTLAQTWLNKEIIVVNDGSTDGSGEILDSFRDNGVKVIHEKCGSASAARNRAFRESKGDYIKFFDADDLLEPRTVELQMESLQGSSNAIASAEWGRFYKDDLSTFKLNPQSVWRDMEAIDWLIEAWKDARPMMQPGMFLIPKTLLKKSGGWDESLSLIDDFEFFARVISNASEVRFTPAARLYYRSGIGGSLSGQKSRKAVESAFHSLMRGTSLLLQKRSDAAAKQSCANLLQDFIYTYYPEHPDLRAQAAARVQELGGANVPVSGSPRFQKLCKVMGWKAARHVQKIAGR
jgi:glycosyltransferase involved in cell wall biosynthesis